MKTVTRDRVAATIGSIVFLFVAPGLVAGLLPWWLTHWIMQPAFLGLPLVRVVGAVLIAAGILVVLESFARFAIQGIGTPAPIYPTNLLVVGGFYRHVRNPMYVAVVSIVIGEALLLGSAPLLGYAAIVWLAMHAFVMAYEEPTLRKSFGAEYNRYAGHVPRGLPRLRGWRRDWQGEARPES
jgi:protein-S-isoprenylcysteine O-methyltransferase Ste14